jgi:hypothetical protein
MIRRSLALLAAVPLLASCATVPAGPGVMVLPGAGKPYEQFQADDAACRQWAFGQVGVEPGAAAAGSTVWGAVIGTLLGAGLGAAFGAASGNAGMGAAIGAGGGLFMGSLSGADAGYRSGVSVQRRYDYAYQQCMYAKGNVIPSYAGVPSRPAYPAPPPPDAPPPPPPGAPPPPPPPPVR